MNQNVHVLSATNDVLARKKAIGNVWKWAQLFSETAVVQWGAAIEHLRAGVAVLMRGVSVLKHLIFSAMSI